MRLAPLPLLLHRHGAAAVALAGRHSGTTHNARTAVDCCRYAASLLVGAVHGVPKAALLAEGGYACPGLPDAPWAAGGAFELCDEVADVVLRRSFCKKTPPTAAEGAALRALPRGPLRRAGQAKYITNSGYVVATLESALHALATTASFAEGAAFVANLGDDADTVTCIYGMFAGAVYGVDAVPDLWRHALTYAPLFPLLGDALCHAAEHVHGVNIVGATAGFSIAAGGVPAAADAAVHLLRHMDGLFFQLVRRTRPGPRRFKSTGELTAAQHGVLKAMEGESAKLREGLDAARGGGAVAEDAAGAFDAVVAAFTAELNLRFQEQTDALATQLGGRAALLAPVAR